MKPSKALVREMVRRFPDAPALTLAKKLYAESPECWTSLEACRTAVRSVLGVQGAGNRKTAADKSLYREPRKAGWTDVIPEALQQFEGWAPVEIPGPHRVLLLSDVHIPWHDPQALELALEHGATQRPTMVLLNGDIADHFDLSKWEKNPKLRNFRGEKNAVKFFLAGLRKRFGRQCRIIYKHGNHEERYEAYMRFKCPELLDIEEFSWEVVFGLAANKIELVRQKRPIRLGKLNVLHGHEHQRTISAPVNPARGLYLRCKAHAICGHWHQTSSHSEKNVEGKVITTFSTGCLCEMHPEYAPINSWSQGAAFIDIDKDGGFHVENFRIVNGKIW